MERAELDRLAERFEREVRERFPGAPIERVAVLQYGDDPEIEPGELLARVYLAAGGDRRERERVLEELHDAHRDAIRALRQELDRLVGTGTLELVTSGGEGDDLGPIMRLKGARSSLDTGGVPLTPVMARLGPAELETVDTLITAGIAANRAEAVRWAITRIRERPAFEQLRQRAREIEELKDQF